MVEFGIMQGRLLKKYKDRYQSHPVDYWQQEFLITKKLNLNYIEFIFDYYEFQKNPLSHNDGLKEVNKISKTYNINVSSICADIFMQKPIFNRENNDLYKNKIMNILYEACKYLNISDIVIPLVDESSISNCLDRDYLVEQIRYMSDKFESINTNICLETDLDPENFIKFIDLINKKNIKINYDIGNSISNGYDPIDEFNTYSDLITLIHLKDRKFMGPSVLAGKGDVDFNNFFKILTNCKYNNNITFQLYRNEKGLDIFIEQFKWIKDLTNFKNLISENE